MTEEAGCLVSMDTETGHLSQGSDPLEIGLITFPVDQFFKGGLIFFNDRSIHTENSVIRGLDGELIPDPVKDGFEVPFAFPDLLFQLPLFGQIPEDDLIEGCHPPDQFS